MAMCDTVHIRQHLSSNIAPPTLAPLLPISQSSGEARRQRSRRQEDSNAQTNFVSQIEERQQIRYAWTETRLADSEQEPQRHHPGPVGRCCLARCEEPPAQHTKPEPAMGEDNLPHERLKLEQNVTDIEDGQKPLIAVSLEVQIFLHARNFGITDIGAVEKGENVERGDEGDNAHVHLTHNAFLDVWVDMMLTDRWVDRLRVVQVLFQTYSLVVFHWVCCRGRRVNLEFLEEAHRGS